MNTQFHTLWEDPPEGNWTTRIKLIGWLEYYQIEIATSNATNNGPIYFSQFGSTPNSGGVIDPPEGNWTRNQRVLTLLDEQGNTTFPGSLTINVFTISGTAINALLALMYPVGTIQCFGLNDQRTAFINNMRNFGQTWTAPNNTAALWSGTGLSWWFAVRE